MPSVFATIILLLASSLEGSEDLQNHHRPGKRGGQLSGGGVLRGMSHCYNTLRSILMCTLIVVHDDMARHAAAIYDHVVVSLGARYLFSRTDG